MDTSGQFQACLFFLFFYFFIYLFFFFFFSFSIFDEKISRAQKHVKSENQLTKQNKQTLNNKDNNFSCVHKLLGVTCSCAREVFSSKKKIYIQV